MAQDRTQATATRRAAAFYDLDGTLIRTNLVHVFGYYARNDQGLLRSLKSVGATIAGLPLFLATDFYSRKLFNDVFFKWYRGQSCRRAVLRSLESGFAAVGWPTTLSIGRSERLSA